MRWMLVLVALGCGAVEDERAELLCAQGGSTPQPRPGPRPGDRDYVPKTDVDFYWSQEALEGRQAPGETDDEYRVRVQNRRTAEAAGHSQRPGAGEPLPAREPWGGPVTTETALAGRRNLAELCGLDAGATR